ncbi:TIGR04197 family type VII secretion effector [Lachnobacterium bovis]|uniref:TIGR04197 family type VII secretion effector n=1 Tax=Lachnobacterium bovis TaxID=140626 RepID=UPI00048F98EC|nr:TIGR04197 family type VII secretion effector [Lachnobacterium bovis]
MADVLEISQNDVQEENTKIKKVGNFINDKKIKLKDKVSNIEIAKEMSELVDVAQKVQKTLKNSIVNEAENIKSLGLEYKDIDFVQAKEMEN